MTYLQLINKVLRGLREDTVQALTADYPLHIGQFVNEAKADIEDAGPWKALRTTVSKTLTPATSTLDLTAETNDRSYLLVSKNQHLAYLTTTDKERFLQVVPVEEIQANQLLCPTQPNDVPYLVGFARASGGITAHFWPTPDAAYTVKFVFVVPQDDLADEDDELTIPSNPVWRRALVLAMEERGEEFAGPLDAERTRAGKTLDQAVLNDFGAECYTFEAV